MFIRILFMVGIFLQAGLALSSECLDYQEQMRWHSTLKVRGLGYLDDFPVFRSHTKLGSHIYSVKSDSMLVVNDVSQPDSPFQVTAINLGVYGYKAVSSPGTVIVAGYEGGPEGRRFLLGFDVQNPGQPILVQTVTLPTYIQALCLQDDRLYVALNDQTLRVYDLVAPGNLSHVHTLAFGDSIDDLDVHQGLLYVSMYEELLIMDLSDPTEPVEVNRLMGYGFQVDVRDTGTDDRPNSLSQNTILIYNDGYIRTYDATDPENLSILGEIFSPYSIYEMDLQDESAIIKTNAYTFYYPLSAVGEFGPSLPLSYETNIQLDVFSDQDFIYYCSETSISLLAKGAGQPAPMSEAFTFPSYERSRDMQVIGSYALVALDDFGMAIYDLSDPEHAQWTGTLNLSHDAGKIVSSDFPEYGGDLVFVIGDHGTSAVDITDSTHPFVRSTIAGPGYYSDSISSGLSDDRLYINRPYHGFEIVDVSDPDNVHLEMDWAPGFYIVDMAAEDGLLHIVDGDGFYRVFSTTVLPPVELANLQVSNLTSGLSIQDDLALIGSSYYGATLVDISDPVNPSILSQTPLLEFTDDVLLVGDMALVGSDFWIQMLDISDPLAPRMVGNIWAPSKIPLVMADGTFVLWSWMREFHTAAASCGMLCPVMEVPAVEAVVLAVYPNPFNPRTTVSFQLAVTESVELGVYDLAGRLVKVLVAGEVMAEGPQQVEWNGLDENGGNVASGLYLVRLEAGTETAIGRMVLLR